MFGKFEKGLIVSCQALEDEPLHSSFIMGRMSIAAEEGGAIGIRANSVDDIREIKMQVDLPVIGIIKKEYPDTPIYITGTIAEVKALVEVGCDLIAVDATNRKRHKSEKLVDFYQEIKKIAPHQMLMADVSTVEEAINAQKIGFDCVSTTLMGYTENSQGYTALTNNYQKLIEILDNVEIPVFAEGHVETPKQAFECLQLGAQGVVVGGAITRPQLITKKFVEYLKKNN